MHPYPEMIESTEQKRYNKANERKNTDTHTHTRTQKHTEEPLLEIVLKMYQRCQNDINYLHSTHVACNSSTVHQLSFEMNRFDFNRSDSVPTAYKKKQKTPKINVV